MGIAFKFSWLYNLLYVKNEFMNWADFLKADSAALIPG